MTVFCCNHTIYYKSKLKKSFTIQIIENLKIINQSATFYERAQYACTLKVGVALTLFKVKFITYLEIQ